MAGFARSFFAVTLIGSSLASGGCTRTSDGSYEIRNSTMPAFMGSSGPSLQVSPQSTAVADFPSRPQAEPVRRKPRGMPQVAAWKPAVQAPFHASAQTNADGTLTCRNEQGEGGRVKVVCD